MGFRKIIGFGGSSFVVSLPKDWVVKNGLKKGDDIVVDLNNNIINIRTVGENLNSNENLKEITIEFDGNKQRFKAELIYAYINNFNIINIVGTNLHKSINEIRKVVESLAALEVMQQSHNKIVLKDLLNVADVAPYDTVRRMDRIVLLMADDVMNCLNGHSDGVIESLEQKESDLNKLANLMFKVLKRGFNPADATRLGLNIDDLFYYWELTLFMEKIGDQMKRIPRHIKGKVHKQVIDAFSELVEQYKLAMKANFTKNITLGLDVISRKGYIFDKLDYCVDKLPRDYVYSLEKMRAMNIHSGNLVKALLKMGLKNIDKKQS